MKKWNIIKKLKIKNEKLKIDDVVEILLKNRGVTSKKERDSFINPKLESVTPASVGINKLQLQKAVKRIKKAIKEKEQIVVFGDYDVDGICGAAILWEVLYSMEANVLPYIPHRVDEGYGLSIAGIKNILAAKVEPLSRFDLNKTKLIITVDNGIVANEAVDFANKNGIDVIITDHHVPSEKKPKAFAIVHTTNLCGSGVAFLLAQEILNSKSQILNKSQIPNTKFETGSLLELVALATIADLVPLIGANRTLTKFGLEALRKTKRIGLLELFAEAALDQKSITTYEVGHIIAPRLNAMGRMEYAMESLRLLCTRNAEKAALLAQKLGRTNRDRQLLTEETVMHAKSAISHQPSAISKLLFIAHESYQQGVVGLVAGKLVEEYYRPAIVISKGEKYSKASARSVHGFNIIEFIRSASEHLVDAGGHPMAAGFTVETSKLEILQKALEEMIEKKLDVDLLTRTLRVDMELPFEQISAELYEAIQKLAPFGMGNPEPTFVSRGVLVEDLRVVGRDGKHLKLRLYCHPDTERSERGRISDSSSVRTQNDITMDGIAFGMGERSSEFKIGSTVDIAYTIAEDTWLAQRSLGGVGNGRNKLQLKIKDIKPTQ